MTDDEAPKTAEVHAEQGGRGDRRGRSDGRRARGTRTGALAVTLAVLAVGAAGGVAWRAVRWTDDADRRSSSSVASSSPSSVAASASRGAAYVPRFLAGHRFVYALDYASEALVDGTLERPELVTTRRAVASAEASGRNAATLAMSSSVEGTLAMTVLETRGLAGDGEGGARVLVSLTDTKVTVVLGDKAVPLPRAVLDPLARGFVMDVTATGEVSGIEVEQGADPMASRLAAQVAAFVQLVAPRGHGAAWETEESDPLGRFHASYVTLDDVASREGGVRIRKTMTREPRLFSGGGALGRLQQTGGTRGKAVLAFEVSPEHGVVTDAAGALSTEHVMGELRVGAEDASFTLALTSDEELDASVFRALREERDKALAAPRPLDPSALARDEEIREHERIVAQVDLPALLEDARLHPPPPQSAERATLVRILAAEIDVSPEARNLLAGKLVDPTIREEAFLPIVVAFGNVGSEDAQDVLVRTIERRPKGDIARPAAMVALSGVSVPSNQTIARFEAWADDSREPASALALRLLGRAAGQLAAVDFARGKPVVDRLVVRLDRATDDGARVLALEAIGNAGTPLTESITTRWSFSESLDVRRSAVDALRLVPTDSAERRLLEALASDAASSVRRTALDAVVLRPADDAIADAIADRVTSDPADDVKKPALSSLQGLCRRSRRACDRLERLAREGDAWTRHELVNFKRP